MATPPRYFQKNSFYHVYNRGNRKQNIFFDQKDYERFLQRMDKYKQEFDISILSYCLMPNHFHLLLKQNSDTPITGFMLQLGTSYSKYFNIKYQQVGSVFQGRFQAKHIGTDEYLLHLSRYIHRNPINILSNKNDLATYLWSSYALYLKKVDNSLADPSYILSYFSKNYSLSDYRTFVEFETQTLLPESFPI